MMKVHWCPPFEVFPEFVCCPRKTKRRGENDRLEGETTAWSVFKTDRKCDKQCLLDVVEEGGVQEGDRGLVSCGLGSGIVNQYRKSED